MAIKMERFKHWFFVILISPGILLYLVLFLIPFIGGALWLFIFSQKIKYKDSITDISLLKKGDIILTGKQTTKYSWPIQVSNIITRKPKHRFWTHAALYAGNGKLWEAQMQGIREYDINEYIKNGFIIRAFRHKYLNDETVFSDAIKFCYDRKGWEYGKRGLVFYIFSTFIPMCFNFIFANKHIDALCDLDKAFFCSELIVEAFEDSGHPLFCYDGWRIKPTDFISNPLLKPVT